MISHAHRCIFVHIPRCGGSSIEYVLWPNQRGLVDLWMGFVEPGRNKYQTGGLQHLTARFIRDEVGEDVFSSYLKFAVVRNPFDKAVSQYAFLQRRADLRSLLNLEIHQDFKAYLRRIEHVHHVQWLPQYEFLYDGNTLLVDRIIRFEHFNTEVAALLTELGLPPNVPAVHGSERGPTLAYYDDEAVSIVERLYSRDLELFGYKFPYAS